MLIAIVSFFAQAFDVTTHTAMTSEAIKQSAISSSPNTSPVFVKLGLFDKPFAIGSSYIDIGSLIKRNSTTYEGNFIGRVGDTAITGLVLPTADSIPGWIIRGTVREDDNTKETRQGTPQGDEPNGVFDRVYGHFFDPVNDRGLTISGNGLGPRAPEWATLEGAVVTGLGFGSRQNYYNWPSAREAMWRALTLKAWNNGTLSDAVDPSNWPYSTREQLRQAYWATMFRAVGDIVHLVQDMAQPQHTRNDAHSGYGCVAWTGSCAGGHASFFENYLRARTLREDAFRLAEGFLTLNEADAVLQRIAPNQLTYCCYTKPSFARAEEFFSTATGAGNAAGKGMANYSNRGFYSFGTNIGTTNFPSPPPYGTGLGTETIDGDDPNENRRLKNMAGKDLPGARLTIRTGTVTDTIGGPTEANVRLAAQGYWDQFLLEQGAAFRQYTLNYYNYDDQARLLIPRAVAYSAGLIDYFFRGQMEILLPVEGVYAIVDHSLTANNCKDNCGFTQIKLKVANSTPDIVVSGSGGTTVPQIMPGGTLVAVAKYRKNTCYTADLEGEYDSDKLILGVPETKPAYAQRCRSADEEITVSQPLANQGVPACGGNCESNALPLIFTFNTPIPINATDLYLQVVYRGPLGAEQDAVVVATKDIPEPTYFALLNTTDYMVCSGGSYFYRNADGTGYPGAPLFPYQTWMAFQPDDGSSVGTAMARIDDLRPKEYVRVAALVDTGRTYARNIAGLAGPDLQLLSAVNTGLNQTNYAANGTSTADVFDFRINTFRKVKSHFAFTRVTGSTDCVPASPPAHAYPPEPAYPPHTPPAMRAVTIRPFS